MKLMWFLVTFFIVETFSAREPINFTRFTRTECSASNKTVTKFSCKVKLISRSNSFLNFNFDFNRPLNDFSFNAATWKQTSAMNYRKILDLKNISACDVIDNILKYPMLVGMVDWLNTTFTGIVHKCPYNSMIVINASMVEHANPENYPKNWQFYPPGIYKSLFKVHDKLDDNIASLVFYQEIRYHFISSDF